MSVSDMSTRAPMRRTKSRGRPGPLMEQAAPFLYFKVQAARRARLADSTLKQFWSLPVSLAPQGGALW